MKTTSLPIHFANQLTRISLTMLAGIFVAHADTDDRWIIGSYVNVRAEANAQSKVLDRLVANTPVRLQSRNNTLCEIVFQQEKRGFVSCEFIGEQPLSIDEVGVPQLPGYSPSRAFWVQPSVDRLFQAGRHFQGKMLAPKQNELEARYTENPASFEHKAPELKRYPIPEFEAMKALLTKGFIADIRLAAIPQDALDAEKQASLQLPQVRASYFADVNKIGAPYTSTEGLSAQFQRTARLKILDKPIWVWEEHVGPRIAGAWDIGAVEIRLEDPLFELAIDRHGNISVGVTHAPTRMRHGDDTCRETFLKWEPEELRRKSKRLSSTLAFFRVENEPTLSKASVRTKTKKRQSTSLALGNPPPIVTETWHYIDIDQDGADDAVVLDQANFIGDDGPAFDLDRARFRSLFVNAGGRWYLLGTDTEQACGC